MAPRSNNNARKWAVIATHQDGARHVYASRTERDATALAEAVSAHPGWSAWCQQTEWVERGIVLFPVALRAVRRGTVSPGTLRRVANREAA